MGIVSDFVGGMFSVIKVIGQPKLYRAPHRTSAEAFRADWQRVGDDIRNIVQRLEMDRDDDN
ncbi:MAG: hypothetical protein SFT92_02265 [Rickettsiales bacterium]|nr:hypothetical protein [Rickettsiales bacterium]